MDQINTKKLTTSELNILHIFNNLELGYHINKPFL